MGFVAMRKAQEKNRCVVFYEGRPKDLKGMRQSFTHIELFRWNAFRIKMLWGNSGWDLAVAVKASTRRAIRRDAIF